MKRMFSIILGVIDGLLAFLGDKSAGPVTLVTDREPHELSEDYRWFLRVYQRFEGSAVTTTCCIVLEKRMYDYRRDNDGYFSITGSGWREEMTFLNTDALIQWWNDKYITLPTTPFYIN